MSVSDQLSQGVRQGACRALDGSMKKIGHCLDQLSEEQVWWRPAEEMNSIGNLMLHLAGNLRQWIVAGVGGAVDNRDRPAEFAPKRTGSKEQLWNQLELVVEEAKQAIFATSDADLIRLRLIQGFEVSGIEAVFDSVPHFQGHAQEIICLSRMQLGERYEFNWEPSSPDDGA
ncbi:DUF1572 family protein [Aeoliella sp.]|uniref:DUF1572 family protein n=1 Tax=Aeoliella sp. TaxID=2795800 RepID=UPI003CCB796B